MTTESAIESDPASESETVYVGEDVLAEAVRAWLAGAFGRVAPNRSLSAVARTAAFCLDDDEPVLASCLVLISNARTCGLEGQAFTALSLALGRAGVGFVTLDDDKADGP